MSDNLPATLPNLKPTIRGKVRPSDVEAIAKLVAKRLTETEACALLCLKATVWFSWKARGHNAQKFDSELTRLKAALLQSHLDNIEDGAYGRGAHRKADWRASDRILAISAPERYSQAAQANTAGTAVLQPTVVNVWIDQAKQPSQPRAVLDAELLQLPEKTVDT